MFFTDSGSVAIEVGMKMAIQFWLNNGVKGRHKFIHFRGGYHGDTFATMAVCDPEEGMHSHFSGVLTPQILAELPVNDEFYELLDKQMASHADEVAGLLIEPLVQGAGGMVFHSEEVLTKVAALCKKHDILRYFGQALRCAAARDDIFALCVDQKLTVNSIFPC